MARCLGTFLCICFILRYVHCFLPNRGSAILDDDFTQEDIVKLALSTDTTRVNDEEMRLDEDIGYSYLKEKILSHVEDESRLEESVSQIVKFSNMVDRRLQQEYPAWWFADEKITEGHTLLLELRERVLTILSSELPVNLAARETLGQIFHLLTMFYSNTNWVEMGHDGIYKSLGIPNKAMVPVAPSTIDTCRECGDTIYAPCVNNTLTSQFLTSGYFGHHLQEESSADDSDHVISLGKCRHGGLSDHGTRLVSVPGGINKQSGSPQFSPHYYLHKHAASLAVQHIQFYLFNKDVGLFDLFGREKFAGLFTDRPGIHVFVNIQNESERKEIVKHLQDSDIHVLNTTSLEIACLRAESTLVVIINVEDGEERGHQIYEEPWQCGSRDIHIVYIHIIANDLTGLRRKRALSGLDIYHLIADTSGGTVYETDKSNIGAVVDIIKESVSTKPPITVMKFTQSISSSNEFTLPIDALVHNLTIKIQASATYVPTMNLYHPSGVQEQFTNSYIATKQTLGSKLRVIKLFNPTPGIWRMRRMSTLELIVIVTASTDLDFSYQFMQPGPGGFGDYPLIGRPIAGVNTTVQVSVPLTDRVGSVDRMLLLDRSGKTVYNYTLSNVGGRRGKTLFKTHILIPTKEFEIAVEGTDMSGNVFRRLDPIIISSLAIQLEVMPSSGTLYINETITIPYRVRNVGGGTTTIKVSITDDLGYAQSPTSYTYSIPSHGSRNGSFVIKAGPTKGKTTTVTISAKASGAPDSKVQFNVRRITVEEKIVRVIDKTPPVCNITDSKGKCDFGSDICQCSKQTWEMSASVGDDGDGLLSVFSSGAGNSSTFTKDTFAMGDTLSKGIVHAHLRADCCHQQAKITVVDVAGNVGLCEMVITPGFVPPDRKLCDISSIKKPTQTSNTNITSISCNITQLVDSCNSSSSGCEHATWSVQAELGNEGFGRLQVAAVNAGSRANLTRQNNTVFLSTDCCHPDVYINVVDIAGHGGQCHAKISSPEQPAIGGGSSSNVAVIAGGAAGGVVAVGALAGLGIYLKSKVATKIVHESNAMTTVD